MGQSRRMILFIISLTTLSSGSCSEGVPKNWHDAQMLCRKSNTVLTNVLQNASTADGYYWTGYHVCMSQWIKIIGCFLDIYVKKTSSLKGPFEMQFPSAGLCREICLKLNSSVFGVKYTKCDCLKDVPLQENVPYDQCNFTCENKYPNETSIKFSKVCGGENTYNVFKSGSAAENSVLIDAECLSFQCPEQSKKFLNLECHTPNARICNRTVVHNYATWNMSSELCKNQGNAYLFGDVPIHDVQKACEFIEGTATGPTWLGIAKEIYISMDGVSDQILPLLGTPSTTYPHPKRCLKCNSSNCMFADCAELNIVTCMQMQQTITTPTTTTKTSHTSSSTTMTINKSYSNTVEIFSTTDSSKSVIMEPTTFAIQSPNRNKSLINSKDDSVPIIPIALPVTIFITVGSVALILGILWKRRQTEKNAKTKQTQHDTDSSKYSEKNNVDHSLPNNYFVLAKSKLDSDVDSTNYTTDKYGENPYNESSDADYDHLGGNIRKKVEEDTYHHAFFSSIEDESDYGVKNISEDNLTENPYDHTNTEAYQTTMPENEYNTISLNP